MKVYQSPNKYYRVENRTENICLLIFQSIQVTVQISEVTSSILLLKLRLEKGDFNKFPIMQDIIIRKSLSRLKTLLKSH